MPTYDRQPPMFRYNKENDLVLIHMIMFSAAATVEQNELIFGKTTQRPCFKICVQTKHNGAYLKIFNLPRLNFEEKNYFCIFDFFRNC